MCWNQIILSADAGSREGKRVSCNAACFPYGMWPYDTIYLKGSGSLKSLIPLRKNPGLCFIVTSNETHQVS
ncbi:hypothetical protein VTI28DRAFT_5403 [Corynascus sepedonium]